jgi:mannitol-1-phosphate 5-dehydrogenase
VLKELPSGYAAKFDKYIGLVEASIGRMVPVMDEAMQAGNILRVYVEEYDILPVDKDAFIGEIPKIKNLLPYSPFSLYIERKLFMHNMSHALTAYLGNLYGDKYIYQAIARPEIRVVAYGALIESARALATEHDTDFGQLADHANNLIYRFQNAALADTAERVGKDTVRKLSYSDRLTGALRLCNEHGVRPAFICIGIAAALLFAPNSDPQAIEVSSYCTQNGVFETLVKYSELNRKFKANPQIEYITELYKTLKSGGNINAAVKLADNMLNKERG